MQPNGSLLLETEACLLSTIDLNATANRSDEDANRLRKAVAALHKVERAKLKDRKMRLNFCGSRSSKRPFRNIDKCHGYLA